MLTMDRDPSSGFDWSGLYRRYDDLCTRFSSAVPQLVLPEDDSVTELPHTDRNLYYRLTKSFRCVRSYDPDRAAHVYTAMLYWKHYWNHRRLPVLTSWGREAREPLRRLLNALPTRLDRNLIGVIKTVEATNAVPGMAGKGALATKTTFLHFMYPDAVPVFDRIAVSGAGADIAAANKMEDLEEYIKNVWRLTARHRAECSSFTQETPLRVIEMALWVQGHHR